MHGADEDHVQVALVTEHLLFGFGRIMIRRERAEGPEIHIGRPDVRQLLAHSHVGAVRGSTEEYLVECVQVCEVTIVGRERAVGGPQHLVYGDVPQVIRMVGILVVDEHRVWRAFRECGLQVGVEPHQPGIFVEVQVVEQLRARVAVRGDIRIVIEWQEGMSVVGRRRDLPRPEVRLYTAFIEGVEDAHRE